jgi:hypothetical protein
VPCVVSSVGVLLPRAALSGNAPLGWHALSVVINAMPMLH